MYFRIYRTRHICCYFCFKKKKHIFSRHRFFLANPDALSVVTHRCVSNAPISVGGWNIKEIFSSTLDGDFRHRCGVLNDASVHVYLRHIDVVCMYKITVQKHPLKPLPHLPSIATSTINEYLVSFYRSLHKSLH